MTPTLSPGHDIHNLTIPMSTSQYARRTSRSSGSQRSSRIEKPRSDHNSPRTLERRKTTSGTKRYATLDDHYNMMFGIQGQEMEKDGPREPARPMSWHPASAQFHVPSRYSVAAEQSSPQDWARHNSTSSCNSAYGSDFYSLSARSSMYPEQTQNSPSFEQSHEAGRGSQSSDGSWQSVSQRQSHSISSYSTPSTEPLPWYLSEWARRNQAQADISKHGSTDFLPIQHPAAEAESKEDEDMEEPEKELVGMGLYDLPDSSLEWPTNITPSTGKGLKLEETWQPPEEDSDDENEDASSDDGSVDEPHPIEKVSLSQPIPPVSVVKPQIPENMEGQSFFFDDDDESYTKEWWFQQLKQPSLPVRDAGLGYGWL
ncbi:hypothetical protein CC78DRAFT_220291 [Lojkania enalia]|uniref:Uncharacterized protein n=1 Tax=Lojkania enalia TaxID=147567 RepID=A0A9P4KAP3_9PLEO|nr:hypothetical protein CC78DRAFT_220291 [Didymosphaeria enalia]